MKTLITLIVIILTFVAHGNAQFYSGKFSSGPKLGDFDQFIVIQHPHHEKFGGAVSVEAFEKSGELWHTKAALVDEQQSERFIRKFGADLNIESVYELGFVLEDESWKYYLLGYHDEQNEANFIVVEELNGNYISDQLPVEVNTFTWDQVTAKR